jgi:LysR family glycine cleavage system transcriptional activator
MSGANDIRYPSIDGLRAFEAAARLGSFERAADELNITAGAIGKRIATLEDLLGATLFTRGAKPLGLTATGKEYLVQVDAALKMFAAMPLHRRAAQQTQRLRLTAPPTFARQILVPQLESFTAAHPQLELEVLLSIPYLHATGGGSGSGIGSDCDLEVRHGGAELGGTLLMHDVVLPMIAPGLLARLPELCEPADLAHAPLLRTPIEPWAPWFAAAGLAWPEPAQGPKLVDLGMTLEAAVSGQGVALARPSLARHWLESGALRPLFSVHAQPAHQYRLLPYATGGPAAECARWLVDASRRWADDALALLSARA